MLTAPFPYSFHTVKRQLIKLKQLRLVPLGGRDVEGVERFALLETLGARRASRSCRERGLGGVIADIIMRERAGNACVLTQHVQCVSAWRATGTGATSPQARLISPAL